MALSKAEGPFDKLTVLSIAEGLMALSKAEGRRYASSFSHCGVLVNIDGTREIIPPHVGTISVKNPHSGRFLSSPRVPEVFNDGFVKSPTSALRYILRHCSVL